MIGSSAMMLRFSPPRPRKVTAGRGRRQFNALFYRPAVCSVGLAMAMSGEESSPMPPKQRPDLFEVRLRQSRASQLFAGKEFEDPLPMARWQGVEPRLN